MSNYQRGRAWFAQWWNARRANDRRDSYTAATVAAQEENAQGTRRAADGRTDVAIEHERGRVRRNHVALLRWARSLGRTVTGGDSVRVNACAEYLRGSSSRAAQEVRSYMERDAATFVHEWTVSALNRETHTVAYPHAYHVPTAAEVLAEVLTPDAAPVRPDETEKARARREATRARRARHLAEVSAMGNALLSDAILESGKQGVWHPDAARLEQAANAMLSEAGYAIVHTDTYDQRTRRAHVIGDRMAMRSTPRTAGTTRVRYQSDGSVKITRKRGERRYRTSRGYLCGFDTTGAAIREDSVTRKNAKSSAKRTAIRKAAGKPNGRPKASLAAVKARTVDNRWAARTMAQDDAAAMILALLTGAPDGCIIQTERGSRGLLAATDGGLTIVVAGTAHTPRTVARWLALEGDRVRTIVPADPADIIR